MPRKTAMSSKEYHRLLRASMRPRPDAAENRRDGRLSQQAGRRASMRPRPDAAENRRAPRRLRRGLRRFNEAAARCRGKPQDVHAGLTRRRRASMRPRPDAAENQTLRMLDEAVDAELQ